MPLYRCTNCQNPDTGLDGRDFEAAKPLCPHCDADARDVVAIATIHFDPPSKRRGRGENVAACNPAIKVGRGKDVMFSGEREAVTCPACRASAKFAAAPPAEGREFPARFTPDPPAG